MPEVSPAAMRFLLSTPAESHHSPKMHYKSVCNFPYQIQIVHVMSPAVSLIHKLSRQLSEQNQVPLACHIPHPVPGTPIFKQVQSAVLNLNQTLRPPANYLAVLFSLCRFVRITPHLLLFAMPYQYC